MYKYKFKKERWVANLMVALLAAGGVFGLMGIGAGIGIFDGVGGIAEGLVIATIGMVAAIGAHEGVHMVFAKRFGVHPKLRIWKDRILGFGLGVHFPNERITIGQLRIVLASPQLLTAVTLTVVLTVEMSPGVLMAVWVGMTANLMCAVGDMRSFIRVRKLPKECLVETGYKEAWLYSRKALDDKSVVEEEQ